MRKAKPFLAIPIIIILGVLGFIVVTLINDDMTPPVLPTESTQNNLILTSNGCCFGVEDVRVSLQGEDGNIIEISNTEAVYQHDIYKYEIPDFADNPLKLVVEFQCYYGDWCDFSFPVMEIQNINDLKQTGILLYFQEHDDMYLNVIAGDYRASYKMGSEENRWSIMDTPNNIYSH